MSSELKRVAEMVAGARGVVALTGAGMSAESGVPTFRDALTGLWSRYNPEELATPEAFRRHPERVFGWYVSRLQAVERAKPHDGHHALVKLAQRNSGSFIVVTQNVDGLHRRVGSDPVIELHGSLRAFRCSDRWHPFPVERVLALSGDSECEIPPPSCPECGSPIRPGVVWFGEALPEEAIACATSAAQQCEVMLVIGTSGIVYPAAAMPSVAAAHGARIVEINPDETPRSRHADVAWVASAKSALSALANQLSGAEAAS
jgi:NAD-dependent deacetylase